MGNTPTIWFEGKLDIQNPNVNLAHNIHITILILTFIFMLFILKWNYYKVLFFISLLSSLHVIITSILVQFNIISPIFLGYWTIFMHVLIVQIVAIPISLLATLTSFMNYMAYGGDKTNNTTRNKNGNKLV